MKERRILIVGCPRSGTKYISQVFKKAGLSSTHENDKGKDVVVGWRYAASGKAFCYHFRHICRFYTEFTQVWHQVRNPVKVLRSLPALGDYRNWAHIVDSRLGLGDRRSLEYGMQFWLSWTRRCDDMCDWRYRVEDVQDGSKVWRKMCKRLDLGEQGLPPVSQRNNTRVKHKRYRSVTLADMRAADPGLAGKVIRRAKKYGYDLTGSSSQ